MERFGNGGAVGESGLWSVEGYMVEEIGWWVDEVKVS